ncbi:MAG: DNA primase [Dysgonamonadaceae bacterium]|jgi:DNA primase|nr:DNA primase [Dysgonamonadaceae bacterium]
MIDYLTIERIQTAAQIYDVVSEFITLRKRGVNYVGLCPFHEDKTPSFYVSPAKNICKCFACGEGGTPTHFIMKHEQLSFFDALKYLAKKYGIEIKETALSEEQKQAQSDREAMFILNGFAQKTFSFNLFETEEGINIGLSYFKERNFREDIIKKFQLGYALEGRDAFTKEALKSGYKKKYLEKTGLTIVGNNDYLADRFRGRVIFPVHTLSGKVVAFGGRILRKNDKTAKYLNSPESEIYHKGNELYGIYFARQAIVKQDRCFLVEGYTDVISMHQAGIENVVASSGTALTQGQIRLINRFTTNVTVLYDGDSAGIKAAIRGIDLLLEAGLNIKIVLLPEGEDPDSFSKKQSASSFNNYIAENETDFVQFKARLLIDDAGNDPIKKAKIITEIVDTIALIPEEIIRLVYVKECSRLLNMDERVLVRNIAKKRQENFRQKKKTLYPDPENPEETVSPHPAVSKEEEQQEQEQAKNIQQQSISPFDEYEKNILYYVIRYGERNMYYKDDETQETIYVNVIEFIMSDLVEDELEFYNPLYKKIMTEAFENFQKENFVPEHYFRNHLDPEISQFAVDISTDRYIISKIYTKQEKIESDERKRKEEKEAGLNKMLLEKVPYVMFNYKDSILKSKMNEINEQIKTAEKENNLEYQIELIKELQELEASHKTIALQLGERIITRI